MKVTEVFPEENKPFLCLLIEREQPSSVLALLQTNLCTRALQIPWLKRGREQNYATALAPTLV